jgi:hypothetical protein
MALRRKYPMKKLIALALALSAMLAITGCRVQVPNVGVDGAPTTSPSSYAEPTTQPPSSTPSSSQPPAATESSTASEYTGDFAIEGKWKSVGDYGFGQAQPGSIVVFDGTNCNFFSPQDTYAFYKDGSKWILDCTSMLFSQNQTFAVTIIDEDNIEVAQGSYVTVLKRVG